MILKVNLNPLEMFDFDVILGMDWLSIHRALVDCFRKKVVITVSRSTWMTRNIKMESPPIFSVRV